MAAGVDVELVGTMPMPTPEHAVKRDVKKVLKERGIWFFMPVQNGMGVTGIPDFVCCWHGRFLVVECKAPGKLCSVTPNQKRTLEDIGDHDGLYIVVDSARMLDQFLIAHAVANRMEVAK